MKLLSVLFTLFCLTTVVCKADLFSDLTAHDRLILQKEIRKYILSNPEVIIEAVKNFEQNAKNDSYQSDASLIQENYDELFNDGISWEGGNLDGDITIIEFLDYRCGYCRKAHKEITKLIESDKNIKFIVKEYPILGAESILLSRLTVSVLQLYNKKTYKLIHNKLMEEYINPSEENIIHLLEKYNLDSALILEHLNSDSVTTHLQETRKNGKALNVNGTPTFIIEDKIIRGYISLKKLRSLISEYR